MKNMYIIKVYVFSTFTAEIIKIRIIQRRYPKKINFLGMLININCWTCAVLEMTVSIVIRCATEISLVTKKKTVEIGKRIS